jgi:hypothetical protein
LGSRAGLELGLEVKLLPINTFGERLGYWIGGRLRLTPYEPFDTVSTTIFSPFFLYSTGCRDNTTMNTLTTIAAVLGIIVTLLGIAGGILSLPETIRRFRRDLWPRGKRGAAFYVMTIDESQKAKLVTFLVTEDLMHFLNAFCGQGKPAKVLSVDGVGQFYKVLVQYPPDMALTYLVTDSKGNPISKKK